MSVARRRGQIQRLSSGRWRARIQGRQRASATFDSKEQANQWLAEQVIRRNRGPISEPAKLSVLELLHQWLAFAAPGIRPRTIHDYTSFVRRYVQGAKLAGLRLQELEPNDLQVPITQLLEGGHSTAARHLHGVMRQAFRWALKARKITWNPMDAVAPPRTQQRIQAVFTRNQAALLIAEAEHDTLGALWTLLLGTGLRVGEALALKWTDLDTEYLMVQRNLVSLPGSGNWQFAEPKSRSGVRRIAIPGLVRTALAGQRRQVAELRLHAGPSWRALDLIFPSERGTPLDGGNVRRRWKRFCRRAGLPEVRLYTTRHTCATFLLASGENPKAIAEVLGHSNVVMLLQTYAHSYADERERLADAMDRCFVSALGT